jgi:hypothetical protein
MAYLYLQHYISRLREIPVYNVQMSNAMLLAAIAARTSSRLLIMRGQLIQFLIQ